MKKIIFILITLCCVACSDPKSTKWEIEKLDLKDRLTGDKITLIAQKVNELVDEINKRNEPLPF